MDQIWPVSFHRLTQEQTPGSKTKGGSLRYSALTRSPFFTHVTDRPHLLEETQLQLTNHTPYLTVVLHFPSGRSLPMKDNMVTIRGETPFLTDTLLTSGSQLRPPETEDILSYKREYQSQPTITTVILLLKLGY